MTRLAIAPDFAALPIVARYLAVNRGDFAAASQHAEQMGAPSRVVNILKTAIPAGSLQVDTSAGGAADLGIASAAFMDSLQSTSSFFALLAGGMTRVPLRTSVYLSSEPAVGYAVSEGASKPLTRLTMSTVVIPVLKATAMMVVSNEVLRSSSNAAQSFLTAEMRKAAAAAADAAFLARVLTGATTINSDGGTALLNGSDLKNLLSVVPHHAGSRFYFIAAPDVAISASTLQDTNGMFVHPMMSATGGELLNIPTLVSSAVPAGSLVLVDASGLAGDAEGVTVELSREADVEMVAGDAETLSSITPTPAELVSLWQTNSTAIRANLWFGVERIRADSIAVLDGIAWGPAVTT